MKHGWNSNCDDRLSAPVLKKANHTKETADIRVSMKLLHIWVVPSGLPNSAMTVWTIEPKRYNRTYPTSHPNQTGYKTDRQRSQDPQIFTSHTRTHPSTAIHSHTKVGLFSDLRCLNSSPCVCIHAMSQPFMHPRLPVSFSRTNPRTTSCASHSVCCLVCTKRSVAKKRTPRPVQCFPARVVSVS